MSHFNTTNEKGQILMEFEKKAQAQEELVKAFYRNYPNEEFTPFEVWKGLNLDRLCPLTSIRRAITNLTYTEEELTLFSLDMRRDKCLVKTNIKRPGEFGRPNYAWKWKSDK